MLIIGHRGAAGLVFENTLESFKKAIELGVDMIETDLRQTKDGEVVIMHDPNLYRAFDDKRKLSQVTLAEVKEISKRENREVLTLEELLDKVQVDLNLEIKESGFEGKVLEQIKNFSHKVLISSNKPRVLRKLRTLDEKIPLGFIFELRIWPILFRTVVHLNLYSVHPYFRFVTPKSMKLFRKKNLKVFPWTVNDIHELEILKGFGVDGVITDRPDIIRKQLLDSRLKI